MEQRVVQLLQSAHARDNNTRKEAELNLLRLYAEPQLPFALLSVSAVTDIDESIRQSALLTLNRVVVATWSPKFDEDFKGTVVLDAEAKAKVRSQVLAIGTGDDGGQAASRKIKNAASLVASKIAKSDFPDEWPELLPHLLQTLSGDKSDLQVHGALRVLSDLVESGFSEEQFFVVARDLVSGLYHVASNTQRRPRLCALAVSVFRACFDTLEMVMEDHKVAVKAFLDQALQGWMAFFTETLKSHLPEIPKEEEENQEDGPPAYWRGLVTLKLQVVKVGGRIVVLTDTLLRLETKDETVTSQDQNHFSIDPHAP
jgi:importin-9